MFCFHSVRELRSWAAVSLAAVAFALVDFDGSIWSFEVIPRRSRVSASSCSLYRSLFVRSRLCTCSLFWFAKKQGTSVCRFPTRLAG